MGTIDSLLRSRAYLGVEYDSEEVTEHIVDLFTSGLMARSNEALQAGS